MKYYRKELKYFVSEGLLTELQNRIEGLLQRDEHQKGDHYLIRSIYFDSPHDECMAENEAGIGTREKYRIRAYDCSDERISAEIKIRYRDTISKQSAAISRETFEEILAGGYDLLDDKPVSSKYKVKLAGSLYRPKTIVEYKRSAYVYNPANVRITFDRDVCASQDFESFFDEELHGIPILDDGMQILEIKYDEFLPEEVSMLLKGLNLERCSCSKYYLCRSKLKEFYK